jgi:hypothetical protein
VKKVKHHKKSSGDVGEALRNIKRLWAEAKSQSTSIGTKIKPTGKSELGVVESSDEDENPASKTDDPFLWLRKFHRVSKRGHGPYKWFGR